MIGFKVSFDELKVYDLAYYRPPKYRYMDVKLFLKVSWIVFFVEQTLQLMGEQQWQKMIDTLLQNYSYSYRV